MGRSNRLILIGMGVANMERKKLYSEIPIGLLGAFYIYIQNNIDKGINLQFMNNERILIERELKIRKVSITEIEEIGLEFLANEKGLVKKHTRGS